MRWPKALWRLKVAFLPWYSLWSPSCSSGEYQPSKSSMSVCVKAVCWGGVEMKLHRVLLTGSKNCTGMYLPFTGNFYLKRLFSSVSPLFSRTGGTRAVILSSARPLLFPLRDIVSHGNRKLVLYSRNYSEFCCQTLPVSGCQPRRSQSAALRKKQLLHGGPTWPGESDRQDNHLFFLDIYSSYTVPFDSL